MASRAQRNPAPVPTDASVPATRQQVVDAHGFDPTEFEWRPVPRRPRKDGWTPEVQQRFIEALARTGVVERACEEVNMSVSSAYSLRHAPGAERFAAAWKDVLARAADRVLDIAFEQAIVGEEVPVYDQDGVRTGVKWKYNTRMAMFLLKAYHPERFRHADKETRRADEAPPPPDVPVAEVIASLAPVPPAEPQLLSSTERLDEMLDDAKTGRAIADPPDEGEPYVTPTAPRQPERVTARAHRRRAKRQRREDCEDREDQRNREDIPPENVDDDACGRDAKPGDPLYRWPPDYTYWKEQNPDA